ncbi:unnamed protein product [Prunus armeniaca]
MESIPSDSGQFFEDMKVAMEKDLGKQVFAYFLNAFPNSAQYILGPFFSAYPEEVAKVWVMQPRSSPTYFSDFTWASVWESAKPFKGWPTGTPLKSDPTATKEAPSKKASSAAGKPDHSSSADGKFDWYHWFKALEPKLKGHWKKIGIYDTLLLRAGSPFPCDRSLIIAALCFWSSSTNCMRLRFGMMMPNLLDLAAIAGLRPHGEDFSAANLPDGKVGLDFHKSNKNSGSWVKTYLGHGGDPTDPPSINGVSYTEHVAFLVMWLCKFLACPKSGGITKEFQALAEVLADGHQVAMGPIFLAYLYRGLREVTTKPMDYHASGPIWIFQLWLQLYFPELSPTTVCPNDKALLGPPLLNAPRRKHFVEDCFRFFYECQERTREHLSICLDHRFPDYLALDLSSYPTAETKDERHNMWASILISRDLPYGLMVNKGSNYHCGGELYYPAAAGYQLGFIQSIPIPPMDSVNLLSSWRVEFKDAKEVTTLTDFNKDLVKSFSIPIRDPRFGDSNIFIHLWKEMSAGWFSQPCSEIEDRILKHCPCSLAFQQEKEKKKAQAKVDTAEKENPPAKVIERGSLAKSANANSGRGEKRPTAPIQGDSPAENILPSQTFLRPRKVRRNLSPQGSPRPADPPSSSHSVGAVQSATTSSAAPETQPPTLEKGVGAQVMTSVGKDESAEITTTEHPEDVSTGSHEITPMPDDDAHEDVAELTKEDFPHVPNSQAIFGPNLSSADAMATEAEFQPLFAISSGSTLTRLLEAPQSGPTFQADVVESTAITVGHAIVANGVPPTIPTDESAPPEPVLMSTLGAPTLVVDAIPSELQLEIGESSSFVPAEITMDPSAEDGGNLATVPHEEAPLPSPDQPSGDIFDFLDQWDASISSAEASTRLATSSTSTGALPDSGAEAILRSYRDGDLMSWRTKMREASSRPPLRLWRVERFVPHRRPFLEEQRIGQDLEQRITSCGATMWREIEIARQMQQEAADIDEQVRQLQERKAGIVAKVSEIVRSNRPLEAQLRQDAAAAGAYRERKLMIQSTLSAGDTAMESFRAALRTLFPDA